MKDYSEIAANNFKLGYNCSQSVFLAFAKECGLEENTVLKLASSFGGGMGKLREACGAVTAMFAVAGILKGYTSPDDDISKTEHYKLIQSLAEKFKNAHNTIICRELLNIAEDSTYVPSKRDEQYYKERPCEAFVRTAAEIIQSELL